jgi:hypothetical protein
LNVRDLTPAGVLAARDALKTTPGMANHMLSCGRTLWNWAIPLDMAENNPFERVKPFEVLDRGHVPWPQWVTDYVITHASPDLVRLARLGIMTCQRWKAPIRRHRDDLYLYSPRGVPYTETSIRARYQRWLKKTPEGKELSSLWQKWVSDQARKYEWDIDAENAASPTIHGLRGTGILLRYSLGYEVDQIANDIGMSRPMVERYMRFKDQKEVAASGSTRPRLVEAKG